MAFNYTCMVSFKVANSLIASYILYMQEGINTESKLQDHV